MDEVDANALREVARAEAAMADAEVQLREAWAQRLGAFRDVGLTVAYVHDAYPALPTQRIVITNEMTGKAVDVDAWTACAVAGLLDKEEMARRMDRAAKKAGRR